MIEYVSCVTLRLLKYLDSIARTPDFGHGTMSFDTIILAMADFDLPLALFPPLLVSHAKHGTLIGSNSEFATKVQLAVAHAHIDCYTSTRT